MNLTNDRPIFKVACIGSREISDETNELLEKLGKFIAENRWKVISGNALGSDASYARGANKVSPEKVKLYLPWSAYNKELIVEGNEIVTTQTETMREVARNHHPRYDALTQGAKKMMDRNAGIVIESNIVLAVLNHQKIGGGGTGHGWRIADTLGMPKLDLSSLGLSDFQAVCDWIDEHETDWCVAESVPRIRKWAKEAIEKTNHLYPGTGTTIVSDDPDTLEGTCRTAHIMLKEYARRHGTLTPR